MQEVELTGEVLMAVRADAPLELFRWSSRAWTCLTRNGIKEAGQLAPMAERDVMDMEGVGGATGSEILAWIRRVRIVAPPPAPDPVLPLMPVDPIVLVYADTPIEDLGLPTRGITALVRYRYRTCGDLVGLTWLEVGDMRQTGQKTLAEMRKVMRHVVVAPYRGHNGSTEVRHRGPATPIN